MIRKILFPTDFSPTAQNAFRYCLVLAKYYQASVKVVHVVYPEYAIMDVPVVSANLTHDKVAAGYIALNSFVDYSTNDLIKKGVLNQRADVQVSVEVGTTVAAIHTVAGHDQIDLIVMGIRGHHNALEKSFGSVTTGVAEQAHCSVWLIPENFEWEVPLIAAYASDLSAGDALHLLHATELLEPFSAILHVVHIENTQEENAHQISRLERMISDNQAVLQIQFHEEKKSSVVDGLERFVENHAVNLLVMTSPSRNVLQRMFHHGNTWKMALDTKTPLLVLKKTG
jgi:nucleotide-binding universal stress UspA family protein